MSFTARDILLEMQNHNYKCKGKEAEQCSSDIKDAEHDTETTQWKSMCFQYNSKNS